MLRSLLRITAANDRVFSERLSEVHHSGRRQIVKQSRNTIRERILEILTEAGSAYMKTNEISKEVGIRSESPDYDLLRSALEELEEEGVIFRTTRRRYGRKVPLVIIEGRLENSRGGRWIVVPDNPDEPTFQIEPRLLWTAFHGDRVRAKMIVSSRHGALPQGEVLDVLRRGNPAIVGTLKQGRGIYLDSDDRLIHRTISVRRRDMNGARVGDKVLVRLLDWNDPEAEPEGVVVEKLGRAGDMNAEIASIAAAHRLTHIFPDDVLREAEAIPAAIPRSEIQARRDFRKGVVFTIDPDDARDFDDAISIERHDDGDVTLGVHIADVAHYVPEGSALDREAYGRATSVYLVTGVIPMLPERLSNELCSLRPDEDRLTYSALIRLSPRGAIRGYEIVKGIIRSKRRFTYDQALDVLQTGKGDFADELLAINSIVRVLRKNRRRRGSIDFDRPEVRFRLDEQGVPVEPVQKRPTESTRLIEDCMLLANRVVAEHIGKARRRGAETHPFIYRIHDVPPPDKLQDLAHFVSSLGYHLPKENVRPLDIQKMLESVKGRPEEELINEVTLRSMAKAVYSEHNIGHFGLAFPYYTHFTSPIRRYPDLIAHRMLFEYERGMTVPRRREFARTMGEVADHCSERERAAVEAERESIKIAEVRFLKGHVGAVFEATISGVASFGIFAELKGLGIDGLVRMRSLRDDYYVFDERSKAFRGRRSRRVYRLGDPIHVRVVRVDQEEAQIDMELIDEEVYRREASVDEYIIPRRGGKRRTRET